MDNRLRIGLLLDSPIIPAWAFTALERIVRSGQAEVTLLILCPLRPKKHSVLASFWQDHRQWFYRVFNAIDERIFLRGDHALAPMDPFRLFSNVPVMEVELLDKNGEQHFSISDVARIKLHELDILVGFGPGEAYVTLCSAARYGVWAYRWGDHRKIANGLLGFWEVIERWPETGAALQQVGGAGRGRILFESWFFTYPYSPARSRNYILWAAASFLPRQIERLSCLGEERYFQGLNQVEVEEPSGGVSPNDAPSNLMVPWIMVKLAARNLLEICRRGFYREQWKLLISFSHDEDKDISAFRELSPPQDRFWADPHVVYREPNYYVFIEEYPYRTKRGHISVIEIDRKGNYKQPRPVLQKDCHLSFPFVFEWSGHYYMIPESSEQKTIDLYECVEFPSQWRYRTTLMKGVKAVDTTLFHIHGKWWMFTAMAEQAAAAPQVELFLFYADDLFTEQWQAHPVNPIVSDVKRARGAGGIFLRDGRLFRPSQDCSKAYGYGFDLNEIITLSETEYCERTVRSVRPDRTTRFIATHTYANHGTLTVIDAMIRRPKWVKTG
jgi:hypothetical protein